MIARRVFITCDAEPYCAAELPADDAGLPTVEDVRRQARLAGWQQSITGDYCPDHRRPGYRTPAQLANQLASRHVERGDLSAFASLWLGNGRRSADTPEPGDSALWPVW